MTVTLKKNITLHSAIVYLSLEREVEGKEIQDYLSGKIFENDNINKRVNDYLKENKIYDEQYHLTEHGDSVRESGKLKALEKGKYQIWYTQNDGFFGNKIFYFKRIQPQISQNIKPLPLNFGEKYSCYS